MVDFPLRPSGVMESLQPIPGIKAVVFDFYDTLILTDHRAIPRGLELSVIWGNDVQRELRAAGAVVPSTAHALQERWNERVQSAHARRRLESPEVKQPEIDARDILRQALSAPSLPDSLAMAALARWEAWTTRTRLAPEVLPTLENLRHRGFLLGIGSNAQAVSESLFSLHFGGNPESLGFTLNLWSWRLGLAKPDPGFFAALLRCAAEFRLSPREILFVGNDPSRDIEPAHRAGMATCLYAGDLRCLRPARGPQPDAVITCFSQLPALLPVS